MLLEILAAVGAYAVIKNVKVKVTYREDKPVEYRNISLGSLSKITSSCYCKGQLGMSESPLRLSCHICQSRGM